MSQAVIDFSKSLFNPLHKSYHNEIEVDVLNRCRTVVPTGKFHYFHCDREEHVDIDQDKLYTHK